MPPLKLPYTQQVTAYQWLANLLGADPQIRAALSSRDNFVSRIPGSSNDDNPPTPTRCPWLRMTPVAEQPAPFCKYGGVLLSEAPVAVEIDMAVAGFDPRDFERLSMAVHGAIKPYMADLAATARAGISRIDYAQAAVGGAVGESGTGMIVGTAKYRLVLIV